MNSRFLYNLSVLGWTADADTIRDIVSAVRTHMHTHKGFALMTQEEFRDFVLKGGFDLIASTAS